MRLPGNKMVINGGRFHGLQAGCGDGDWNSHLKDTGLGQSPVLPLTNWVPSFTPTLSHLVLAICLSTPFLAKAKDEGWGRACQFQVSYL